MKKYNDDLFKSISIEYRGNIIGRIHRTNKLGGHTINDIQSSEKE